MHTVKLAKKIIYQHATKRQFVLKKKTHKKTPTKHIVATLHIYTYTTHMQQVFTFRYCIVLLYSSVYDNMNSFLNTKENVIVIPVTHLSDLKLQGMQNI